MYQINNACHFQGDFMSIETVNGKVVLQFYLGGVTYARAETNLTYTNNEWVHVLIDRIDQKGINSILYACNILATSNNLLLTACVISIYNNQLLS